MSGIPNKLYFRIGEVSKLIGVETYVLRYWESEFPDIKPSKSKSGQRLYKRKDVEVLLKIKELLYEERYTIDGARKRVRETMRGGSVDSSSGLDDKHVNENVRQLEVFSSAVLAGESGASAGETPNPTACVKTLKKIRRDLGNILEIIRG